MNPNEITKESLRSLDVKGIALDANRLAGGLKFDSAEPLLEKLRNIFVELDELDFEKQLQENEIRNINSVQEQFLELLRRVARFNPGENAVDTKITHDTLEQEIRDFYNSTTLQFRNYLIYLRLEASRKNTDTRALEDERRATNLARKQSEEMLATLQRKLEEINKREQQLESTSGKVGAKALGIYFNKETEDYTRAALLWFVGVIFAYVFIVLLVAVPIVYYTFINPGGWTTLSWQEGVTKILFFAALWFGFSFIVRNYNVYSHLRSVNRHREAVARTLEDFLAANPQYNSEILKNGTEAMFKHIAIGFITRAEKDTSNPMLEIINQIANSKSL